MGNEKPKIEFSEFIQLASKIQINIGEVIESEKIPETDKLLNLTVNFGKEIGNKTCVTNLGEFHEPESFNGIKLPFVMNLKPTKIRGVVSEVMLMAGELDDIVEISLVDMSVGAKLL